MRKCKSCEREYSYNPNKGHTKDLCNTCTVRKSRNKRKKEQVVYKGGRCLVCGYDSCLEALEFHHLDPDEKEFQIGYTSTRAWLTEKEELDKCVLLCANCHREYHTGMLQLEKYLDKNPSPAMGEKLLDEEGLSPGRSKKENYCQDCGNKIVLAAERCVKCDRKAKEKIDWPKIQELAEFIKETSFLEASRRLNVSDNAIRKRLKNHSEINPKDLT